MYKEILTTVVALIMLAMMLVSPVFADTNNLQVSNLTSSSTVVSWTSSADEDAAVRFGVTIALGDSAVDMTEDDIHFVVISGLSPETAYYYEIRSGSTADDNGGNYYAFTTTKVGAGIPYIVYGELETSGGMPAERSLVRVSVSEGVDSSYPLSALSDANGNWYVNLANLKDPVTNDVFGYLSGDSVFIDAIAAEEVTASNTSTVNGTSPQNSGMITLPAEYICGDANNSGDGSGGSPVDIDDVVYLIAYIFQGGPTPDPIESANVNCSGGGTPVDIDDVVYLIAYIFGGGNPPCDTDGNGQPDC